MRAFVKLDDDGKIRVAAVPAVRAAENGESPDDVTVQSSIEHGDLFEVELPPSITAETSVQEIEAVLTNHSLGIDRTPARILSDH
jgi:hypothetical protein